MSDNVTFETGLERALKLRPHFAFLLKTLFPVKQEGLGGITADRFCRIYYDPEAIAEWELDWVAFRILVQVEHYRRLHSSRQLGREPITWEVGAEIAITDNLANEGLKSPPGTLFSEHFKLPEDLAAEENATRLFRMCMSRRDQISQQLSDMAGIELPEFGSAGSEELKDWEIPEDADVPTIDAMVAAMLQKQQQNLPSVPGTLAGKQEVDVFSDREAGVDYKTTLRGVIGSTISDRPGSHDYSYMVPNPESMLQTGLIMPGMVDFKANIKVVFDTSGSMGDDRLAQGQAEVGGVLKRFEGEGASVFVFATDAAANPAQEVFDKRQIRFIGRGGTNMGAGIEAAAAHSPRADVIVVITDGDTPWPDEGPSGMRVVVVLVGNGTAPDWAYRIIHVEV